MKAIQTVKKLKEKACKECSRKFQPIRPLQQVCSPACAIELGKKKAEARQKKEWIIKKREGLEKLKTKSEFEKDLEKEVNHIVRLIDKGHECISSGVKQYQVNAGHLYSVGAFPALRFNLLNIYNQSVHDNMYMAGNGVIYKERIKEVFGEQVSNEIEELKTNYTEIKLSIPEIRETIKIARRCVRDLKKVDGEKPYTTEERIELRRFYNSVLNIYN